MARGSRGGGRPSGGGGRGYTLRGKNGKINYVGTTNNPGRRAEEHKSEASPGDYKRKPSPCRAVWQNSGKPVGSRRTGTITAGRIHPKQDQERDCLVLQRRVAKYGVSPLYSATGEVSRYVHGSTLSGSNCSRKSPRRINRRCSTSRTWAPGRDTSARPCHVSEPQSHTHWRRYGLI